MKFAQRSSRRFSEILTKYFSFRNESRSLDIFFELYQSLKNDDFEQILSALRQNPEKTEHLSYYIHHVFNKRPFTLSLTEANILSENGFFPELRKRILDKVLPAAENEDTVWFLVDYLTLNAVKDLQFFQNLPEAQTDELFRLLKIDNFITAPAVRKELLFSANLLAWRAIGTAMENEVMNMVPEYRNYDNPFLALQDEMDDLVQRYRNNEGFTLSSKDAHYKQMRVYLTQCQEYVDQAFKNTSKYGLTGKINQSLLKIRQQILRIGDILDILVLDSSEDILRKSKLLFFKILEYKSYKNNISQLFNDSTRLISHLITNHTAETGTHYISSTGAEYLRMFWKASGGGVVVGMLVILKMMYSYSSGSEFSHAFLYAFNYAMGFIVIYLLGFTLATKQPAMTAATMAKVLSDEQNTRSNYRAFAHLVSKLFRSQFIAFVGNVLWAFPVALALIYGLDVIFNINLAADKAPKLLKDLDPFQSKALLHACIAGIFLFISGVISGNIGNNSVYYHIPTRIAKNPLLKQIFGDRAARSLSRYYSKNWAGIVSNFWFGVFLGVIAPVGAFLGLDLDIRHITFSAGNFALGLYGKDFNVDGYTFWVSLITIGLIGFCNFIVSFGLSMMLALRSRKINLGETGEILREIGRYFMLNPLRFFVPIRSRELDSEVLKMMKSTTNESQEQ